MKPKVSVVMSVFNETIQELNNSIDSILNQTYPNFEFIIVDDNPKSFKIKTFLKKIERENSNILLIFNKQNMGAALSRDKGINKATGEFIAIMDADDISTKNRLRIEVNFLDTNNLDFVFPNYKLFFGRKFTDNIYNMNSTINQMKLYKIFSCINDISINSGWLVKKSVFYKLNGYRNLIDEDYDFIARAIIKGYKLGYSKDVLIYKRYRENSVMRKNSLEIYLTSKYIKYFLRNNCIFTMKEFNKFLSHNFNKSKAHRFNKFIFSCHEMKYNLCVRNSMKFIYYLLTTKFSIKFILDKIMIKYKNKKLLNV